MGLEELLERYVATDDEQAMAELVRQTRGKLMAVARRICGADAEDAVQTAYLSLAKRGGLGGAPVLPWLLTVVARIGYRAKAVRAREHTIAERLAPSAAPPEPPEIAIGGEEAELLRRELWKLPPEYRDALQLRYLHGLSGAEVARLLGVNDSTLRTRLHRGRLMLRSRLGRVLFVLPWLFRDASAALVLGGTMKAKVALVALLLAALGTVYVTSRDPAPAPRAPAVEAARRASADDRPAAGSDAALAKAATDEGPVHTGGIVVDEGGAPLDHVRVIARASLPDEHMRLQLEIHFRQQGKEMPKDAHFRPEIINDALRGRAPLAETDVQGRFAIRRPPESRETLLFLREGYAARAERDLGPDMRVVLQPARTIRGVVTDTLGVPISRAGVRAQSTEEFQDLEADDEGRYCFRFLLPGIRSMSAYAHGYDSEFRNAPGDTEDFRLRRMFLVVDVTDAQTKQPLLAACARLATADGRSFSIPGGSTWPGRSGTLNSRCVVGPDVSKVLEPGKATGAVVHVFAPGYVPAFEPVEFRGGEEPPYLRVALRPGEGSPALAGRVKGVDIAHIVVRSLMSLGEDYEYITEADTLPGGRFLFSGLPRQDYLLIVTAPGMGKVTRRVTPPTDDIEIVLEPAAVLEVLARDRRGAPVAGTTIHVELPDGKRHWTMKTDDRGWAVFDELPAEEVLVAAVIEGWDRPIHDRGVPTTDITPRAGARTQVTVTVPEPLPVRIQVRDETGRPHEGVSLSFESRFKGVVTVAGKTEYDRLQALRVTTDPDGTAKADLYPGEYSIMLRDGPTPVRVAVLAVGEEASNRSEFVVSRKPTVVRGSLREYGTDRPLSGGLLHLSDKEDTYATATVRADAHGRFEVRGLARRPHSLSLLTMREEYLPYYCEIDLAQRDELDLDLFAVPKSVPQPCEVAVTVRSRTAGPLAGARVSVRARVGDGWAVLNRGVTDAEGRVVLPAIEAQSYRVWASADGHETADATVERKGQRADLDVELATKP